MFLQTCDMIKLWNKNKKKLIYLEISFKLWKKISKYICLLGLFFNFQQTF